MIEWIMAATDYFNTPLKVCTKEERLDIQARDIDQSTLLFQARVRGYLRRSYKDNIAIEKNAHLASYRFKRYRNTHKLKLPIEYFIMTRTARLTRSQTPTPKPTNPEIHSQIEIKSISMN